MQKRLAVVLLASALSSPAVLAEDVKWDGFYIGVGGHSSSYDISVDVDPAGKIPHVGSFIFDADESKKALDFMLGYKHQLGPVLLGLELRPTLGGGVSVQSVTEQDLFPGLPPNFLTVVVDQTASVKTKGTLALTAEMPVGNRLLIGGEVGVSQATATLSGTVLGPDFFTEVREDWAMYNDSVNKTALTVGLRGTFRVTGDLSVVARYAQTDYGTFAVPVKLGPDLVIDEKLSPAEVTFSDKKFSIGLMYRF